MRRTSFSRVSSALILSSVLALPMAAMTAIPANADGPAFGSGAGATEDSGYFGSGHKDGVIGSGTKSSGLMGSGSKDGGGMITSGGKDGGTIVTSGGLRSWAHQLRNLARLTLATWAGV